MEKIKIDLTARGEQIKVMNAVNNGPAGVDVRNPDRSNMNLFREAEIPFARNHDASFYGLFGGEHTVDVHRIFKNFDADENDPASYWFEPTDYYVKNCLSVGAMPFYRLGASIEHEFKYGTRVPRILQNGQESANISSVTTMKDGQTDMNSVSNTGKSGTSLTAVISMDPIPAGREPKKNLWNCIVWLQSI